MGKKVFLSDVHISEGRSLGKPNSYDWLSQEDRILLSSFLYSLAIDEAVEEVILPGDIFDTWVMPINEQPSSFEDIRNAQCNKTIFETLAQLSGLNIIFDPDFRGVRIPIELNNVDIYEALDIVALQTRSFWKAVNRTTILVSPDNQTKRRDYDELVLKTIYLSNSVTSTEITEAITALRTLLNMRYLAQSTSMNAIIVRDTADRIAIAEKIAFNTSHFGAILGARPERVVLMASGGMSHFPGTDRYASPDFEWDRQALERLRLGRGRELGALTGEELDKAGNVELRTWITLLGAVGDAPADVYCYEPSWHHGNAVVEWRV